MLVKAEEYTKALAYFKQGKMAYSPEEIADNSYLTADMLKCLRKTLSFGSAETYLSIYNIEIGEDSPPEIISAWMLLLYDWYKHTTEATSERNGTTSEPANSIVKKISKDIPYLSNGKSDFAKDFYNNLVAKILKTETKRENVDWDTVCMLCESTDPDLLRTECFKAKFIKNGQEKDNELASTQEEWYAQYSKALFATERYEACIHICESALSKIKKLHYSNSLWFQRRIAQCEYKQNKTQDAIGRYEKIIKLKAEWFLLAELAQLYQATGHTIKAGEQMRQAMMTPGDLRYKVELIEQLGDSYAELNDAALAKEHYKLAVGIRYEAGWKASAKLLSKADIKLGKEENLVVRELLAKLQKIWKASGTQAEANKKTIGRIIKLGTPKDAGTDIWIKAENGETLYAFVRKEDASFAQLTPGIKLRFLIKEVPDKSLNRAVKLEIVK